MSVGPESGGYVLFWNTDTCLRRCVSENRKVLTVSYRT